LSVRVRGETFEELSGRQAVSFGIDETVNECLRLHSEGTSMSGECIDEARSGANVLDDSTRDFAEFSRCVVSGGKKCEGRRLSGPKVHRNDIDEVGDIGIHSACVGGHSVHPTTTDPLQRTSRAETSQP
jgi:hypothetical protein